MTLASAGGSGPPRSYDEFDHTVRGMLNRISAENACRLLPLDPSLRTLSESGDPREDSPPWWAARFAALMLVSYLQVIHTNRCARGLAMRSADNVLPAYLDAVAPLLARSPRLVDALTAWFARLLKLQDLSWPTSRLVLLASHEQRERASLPASSLGRLPAELLKGRILRFLTPPVLPHSLARNFAGAGPLAGLCDCWDTEAPAAASTAGGAQRCSGCPRTSLALRASGILATALCLCRVRDRVCTRRSPRPPGEFRVPWGFSPCGGCTAPRVAPRGAGTSFRAIAVCSTESAAHPAVRCSSTF